TTDNQAFPAVAMDSAGDFVVTWQGAGEDAANYQIYAQRYSAAGVPQTAEFRVNTSMSSHRLTPTIAMDSTGAFVIAWQSLSAQDGSGTGIFAQRYDASAIPQGGEFLVNTYTTFNQTSPAIAMDGGGDFIIVWSSFGQDGNGTGIFAQRYSPAGVQNGNEF